VEGRNGCGGRAVHRCDDLLKLDVILFPAGICRAALTREVLRIVGREVALRRNVATSPLKTSVGKSCVRVFAVSALSQRRSTILSGASLSPPGAPLVFCRKTGSTV